MAQNYPPGFTYADFAASLKYDLFNATQWAELFVKSGAKYTVFLTKHHDGFTLWPSATSFNWNSQDVGPRRDVTGEITAATKAAGLHAGVYHSLFEWVNPLFLADQANNFTTRNFVKKTMGELHDLVSRYEPDVIWSDGDWPAGTAQCDSFIAKYCSKVKRTSLSRHCSRSSWDPQDTRCLLLAQDGVLKDLPPLHVNKGFSEK